MNFEDGYKFFTEIEELNGKIEVVEKAHSRSKVKIIVLIFGKIHIP